MSKVCELTGKRPIVGNSVSHSNMKTKRRFLPNLHTKRLYVPELNDGKGDWVEVKLCTQALRTVSKMGLFAYVQKLKKKGTGVDF
jgi:large subunit ribosomal protein L28